MKRRKAVIAVVQMKYFDISTVNNVEKILKYIKVAKKRGADIVCFPEACVLKTDTLKLNGKIVNKIKNECRKNSIWCIITDDFKIKKKTYNISILIDRRGNIRGGYKKIHLYGDATMKGRNVMVLRTDFGRVGIAICWDIAFPEMFRRMKEAGAEIVFCPSQWWYESSVHEGKHREREMKILESLVLARAFENIFFVALCNPVVDSKYQISYSAIASPTKILKKIVRKEGMITAKLNLNDIKKLEEVFSTK